MKYKSFPMSEWTADIMSDPARDHRLHVELRCNHSTVARLYRDDRKVVRLEVFQSGFEDMPVAWFMEIYQRFEEENIG